MGIIILLIYALIGFICFLGILFYYKIFKSYEDFKKSDFCDYNGGVNTAVILCIFWPFGLILLFFILFSKFNKYLTNKIIK